MMNAAPAQAPYWLHNSRAVPGVTFVLRDARGFADHFARTKAQVPVGVIDSVSGLGDELRSALVDPAPAALIAVQLSLAVYSALLAAAFLQAAIVRVDGWLDRPASPEEFTSGDAPAALVSEVSGLVFEQLRASGALGGASA